MGDAPSQSNNSQSTWDQKLVRWAAVATILGLAVAIYFGVKAKEKKALEIDYLGKLSLATYALGYGEKLKIQYDNQSVNNLTKIAIRVSNAGQIPIEQRDIEKPITFPIPNAKVLDASIVEKFPANMVVQAKFDTNGVQLIHGLMNPGDFIRFEILCEGEAKWPTPEFRISGVSVASVNILESKQRVAKITLFDFPKTTDYFVLVLSSILPALLTLAGIGGFFSAFSGVFKQPTGMEQKIDDALSPKKIVFDCAANLDADLKATMQKVALAHEPSIWFDDANELATVITPHLEQKIKEPAVIKETSKKIISKMRGCVKDVVAQRLHKSLPVGADRAVRKKIKEEKYDPDVGISEFIAHAKQTTHSIVFPKTFFQKLVFIDRNSLTASIVVIVLSGSACLVVTGTWLNLLAK